MGPFDALSSFFEEAEPRDHYDDPFIGPADDDYTTGW